MAIDRELLTASANKLPKPQILYQNSHTIPGDSRWNFRDCKFAEVAKFANEKVTYACIQFVANGSRPLSQQDLDFYNAFERASQNVGLQVACAHEKRWISQNNHAHRNVWTIDYNNVNENIVRQALATWRSKANAILVLLSRSNVALYAAIKSAGDFTSPQSGQIDTSVATICMLTSKLLGRGLAGYLANIQLKLNIKVQYGSINHKIIAEDGKSELPRLLGANTMLVGLDVVSRC